MDKISVEDILNSEYFSRFDYPEHALAASKVWGLTLEEASEMDENRTKFGAEYSHPTISGEFLVIEDSNIDEAFEAYERQIITEVIEPELNAADNGTGDLMAAFDTESYMRDMKIENGYGVMSSWDNNDHEEYINDTLYHVFRNN